MVRKNLTDQFFVPLCGTFFTICCAACGGMSERLEGVKMI